MSLATPEKIRMLQRKLYVLAKEKPRVKGTAKHRFASHVVFGDIGVVRLRTLHLKAAP